MQTAVPRLISLLVALYHITESTPQGVVYSDTQHSTSITEPIDGKCSHEYRGDALFASPPWGELPVGARSGHAVSRCIWDLVLSHRRAAGWRGGVGVG
jgi:hypothetical protein